MKVVILALVFVLSFGVFFKYTKPTYEQTKQIQSKIQGVDSVLERIQDIRELREKLSREYAQFTEERLERLSKILPDHVDNIKLLLDIDGIALQYGMRISDIKLTKSEMQEGDTTTTEEDVLAEINTNPNNGIQSMTLQFSVVSNYDNLKKFVRDLESSLRIIEIEKLTIQPFSDSGNLFSEFDNLFASSTQANTIQDNTETKYKSEFVIRTYWLRK